MSSFKEQVNRFENLDEWFHSSHGSYVAKAIEDELSHLNDILSGDALLQLGGCPAHAFQFRFKHQWLFNPQIKSNNMKSHQISCAALFDLLPLDRESIDCLIVPFTMDGFELKERVIDEMDRILKPMGYVVILGVNPMSFWSLWLKYARQTCFGQYKGYPKSALSIQRAMMHRGYIQCYYNGFYFIPPVSQKKIIHALSFLNQVGKMISPTPSSFYCLVMQKQVENNIKPLFIESKKDYLKHSPAYQPVC